MVIFHALSRHSRKATPEQTTISISSTILFQSNFAGLLKLPQILSFLSVVNILPISSLFLFKQVRENRPDNIQQEKKYESVSLQNAAFYAH
jgi:hypothetical protein